jgi:hypothetical protein
MNKPPSKRSGEHPAIEQFRKKVESINETTMPLLVALNERIERGQTNPPTPEPSAVWQISIKGIDTASDKTSVVEASRLAAALVAGLRAAGHTITQASFTYAGDDVLSDTTNLAPKKDEA